MCVRRGPAEHFEIKKGQLQIQKQVMCILQIYTVELKTWKSVHFTSICYTLCNVCRSVDVTVNHCKTVLNLFHCAWSSNYIVQWDYSGNWDTPKKCKNYIEYILILQ